MKVIVNADDFGGSARINSAIAQAIRDGVVTSTTLMANGPAFDEAVATMKALPQASVGVHLNLTQFMPVGDPRPLEPLLSSTGAFAKEGVYRVTWNVPLIRAVRQEWAAQIQRVRDAGLEVTHLDSHHHVHTLPGTFPALKAVQRQFGIRRVRTTWSIYERARAPRRALSWKKRLWKMGLRYYYRTSTTDHFSDFLMFIRAVREGSFTPRVWPRTLELMVHPNGIPAEDGQEHEELRRGWQNIVPCDVQLVSYRDL